jgi:hypothetical protein
MKIIDFTAGNRAIWINKKHPNCTYIDIRPQMNPDIVCDTTKLPAEIGGGYDLVVYDPPHVNSGPNGQMSERYGHWKLQQIRDAIAGSGREAYRITKYGGLMAFKWNDHDIKLKTVLDLMPNWEPLFGHHMRNGPSSRSQTYWVMLKRKFPLP